MIKDNQKIKIKVEKRTKEHYSKFYTTLNKYNVIEIDSKNLHESSRKKIIVECDICHSEKTIMFSSYMNNIKRGGYYTCIKCKFHKTEETNMKKYGKKYFTNPEKSKKTNLERYGCENVSSSQIIKDKKKDTNFKNWGVDNVFQSEIIKETLKKTLLNKYGVEHPLQNKELLEKSKQTCFKNNGVKYPTMSGDVLIKRNKNNLLKFGKEHYTQTDDYKKNVKETNLDKYGNEWYMSSDDFKNKSKHTNLERYGVEYNMQNEIIYMKAQISGHKSKIHNETNLFYRGTYEKDFLDFCVYNKIKIEKGKRFSYFFDGKKRYYFSDFYLPEKNLIIEIKSDYYFNKYYDMNVAKKDSAIKFEKMKLYNSTDFRNN